MEFVYDVSRKVEASQGISAEEQLYRMKVGEYSTKIIACCEVLRVPGGWVLRFLEDGDTVPVVYVPEPK